MSSHIVTRVEELETEAFYESRMISNERAALKRTIEEG